MPLPPSPFLEQIIRLLMPFFLGSGIDPQAVRADILDTLDCYGVRTRAQMLYAAQALAFSLSAIDTLAEAKSAELSASMRLRLRGCANGLNRSVQQNQQGLAARIAYDEAMTDPLASEAMDSMPQLLAAAAAQHAPASVPVPDAARADAAAPAEASPTEVHAAKPAPAAARPATSTPTLTTATAPARPTSRAEQDKRLWGAAMIETLRQMGMPVRLEQDHTERKIQEV